MTGTGIVSFIIMCSHIMHFQSWLGDIRDEKRACWRSYTETFWFSLLFCLLRRRLDPVFLVIAPILVITLPVKLSTSESALVPGFHVDGGTRLPWRDSGQILLLQKDLVRVVRHRLPFGAISKQMFLCSLIERGLFVHPPFASIVQNTARRFLLPCCTSGTSSDSELLGWTVSHWHRQVCRDVLPLHTLQVVVGGIRGEKREGWWEYAGLYSPALSCSLPQRWG